MTGRPARIQSLGSNTTVSVIGSPNGGDGSGTGQGGGVRKEAFAMAMAMVNSQFPDVNNGGLPMYQRFGEDLEQRHYADNARLLTAFLTFSDWHNKIQVGDWNNIPKSQQEKELLDLQRIQGSDAQALRYNEIITENNDFVGLFEQIASFDAYTHPKTVRLVNFIVEAGYFVVQHFKGKTSRPRPSQVDSAIRPLIRVPAFSAYPSGHATQAYLVYEVLKDLIRNPQDSKLLDHLNLAAERIAKNREYAGVHFPTDTEEGKKLAGNLWQLVDGISKNSSGKNNSQKELAGLIEAARNEWPKRK